MPFTDILTPDFIRTNYLYGVDLTDDDGVAYPDSLFYTSIISALEWMEAELSIVLQANKRTRQERHDVRSWEGDTYYLKTLDHRPILTINEAGIRFAAFQQSVLPNSWVHVTSPRHGQIQIMPGPEGLEGFSFSGGVPILGIDVLVPREYTPRWFQFDYTAGFEEDIDGTVAVTSASPTVTGTGTAFTEDLRPLHYIKVNGETKRILSIASDTVLTCDSNFAASVGPVALTHLAYPSAILDAAGLLSAMLPLDTAGDLIIGAGISNLSLSMDGISQSIGTTAGVENSGYGARIIQYKKRLDTLMAALKADYKNVRVMIL